jgi:hypothetical protein
VTELTLGAARAVDRRLRWLVLVGRQVRPPAALVGGLHSTALDADERVSRAGSSVIVTRARSRATSGRRRTSRAIAATDLFTLNSTLGASIEVQVVQTLNLIRTAWETDEFKLFGFRRYEQGVPRRPLRGRPPDGTRDVRFGIELKGWYLLSKEKEPSFLYRVDPDACAEWDLLVVVPWHPHNVLSGRPVVLAPFIESARYAAELRNHWWTHEKAWKDEKAPRRDPAGRGCQPAALPDPESRRSPTARPLTAAATSDASHGLG